MRDVVDGSEDFDEFLNCPSPTIERILNDLPERVDAVEGVGFETDEFSDIGCLVTTDDDSGSSAGLAVHVGRSDIDAYIADIYLDEVDEADQPRLTSTERGEHRSGTLWEVCAIYDSSEGCELAWLHPDGVVVTYWTDDTRIAGIDVDELGATLLESLDNILFELGPGFVS